MPEEVIGPHRQWEPRVQGILHLMVLEARDLPVEDSFVRIGFEVEKEKGTKVIENTNNPTYKQRMFFRMLAKDQVGCYLVATAVEAL